MPDITFIVVTIQYLGINNQLFYKTQHKKWTVFNAGSFENRNGNPWK